MTYTTAAKTDKPTDWKALSLVSRCHGQKLREERIDCQRSKKVGTQRVIYLKVDKYPCSPGSKSLSLNIE
jgi:hypothetical protein